MSTSKFTVDLTFGQLERVVALLRKQRDANASWLHDSVDGYLETRHYNSETKEYEAIEPRVMRYQVIYAEDYVNDFDHQSEVLSWFTGERETLDPAKLAVLREARERLDAETAAAKEEADA